MARGPSIGLRDASGFSPAQPRVCVGFGGRLASSPSQPRDATAPPAPARLRLPQLVASSSGLCARRPAARRPRPVDAERKYETRVTASLDVAGYLIAQAHAFRGHDESDSSLNRGNFLEMIEWHKKRNDEVRLAFEELCPLNAQMLSPDIQKDLCSAFAREVKKVIKKEIGDKLFSVLIDESRDISIAEQMAMIVRLVTI